MEKETKTDSKEKSKGSVGRGGEKGGEKGRKTEKERRKRERDKEDGEGKGKFKAKEGCVGPLSFLTLSFVRPPSLYPSIFHWICPLQLHVTAMLHCPAMHVQP